MSVPFDYTGIEVIMKDGSKMDLSKWLKALILEIDRRLTALESNDHSELVGSINALVERVRIIDKNVEEDWKRFEYVREFLFCGKCHGSGSIWTGQRIETCPDCEGKAYINVADLLKRVKAVEERSAPAPQGKFEEHINARRAISSAIEELKQERDNLKTVLHGNQDADYDKQLQIETLKEQLSAYKAKEENASQLSGIRNWDITNWRDHFARIPQEEQTGEDLFLQKCLDAIDKLHWSLDECMRQYDIQQERACDAETKLAAAENDAGMLANVYFFWDDYSSCFRCVHCKHVDYEGHSDDCPIELHRTRLAGKEGE